MATRPPQAVEYLSRRSSPVHHVVGVPAARPNPPCQSLPPAPGSPRDPRPATRHGRVQRRSSQLQCQTSSSGGRRRIGRVQLTGPAEWWLTDSRPPAASVASSHASRKSIQRTSPNGWRSARRRSSPPGRAGHSAAPANSCGGQFGVVADRDGQKLEPAAGLCEGGQRPLSAPSECTQAACRSPGSHRRPGRLQQPRRPVPRDRRGRRLVQCRGGRRGLRRQPVGHPVRAGCGARRSLPARCPPQFPREVAGRGRVTGDDKRLARAAGPAAEPAWSETARRGAAVVVELHPQPGRRGCTSTGR